MPERSAHPTGESKFARRVEKKKDFFPNAIALLAAVPQSDPLAQGEILSADGSPDPAIYVESNGNRRNVILG